MPGPAQLGPLDKAAILDEQRRRKPAPAPGRCQVTSARSRTGRPLAARACRPRRGS
jgi:hypothetical protein